MAVNKTAGSLTYSASDAIGWDFDTDSAILIEARFDVTAKSGVYRINTNLETVTGADDHVFVENGEVKDSAMRKGSKVADKFGVEMPVYTGDIPDVPVEDPTSHEDPTSAPTNPDAPKTGSTEIAVIFLMILVLSAAVVVVVKKRRFN